MQIEYTADAQLWGRVYFLYFRKRSQFKKFWRWFTIGLGLLFYWKVVEYNLFSEENPESFRDSSAFNWFTATIFLVLSALFVSATTWGIYVLALLCYRGLNTQEVWQKRFERIDWEKLNPVKMELSQDCLIVEFGEGGSRKILWPKIREFLQLEDAFVLRYGYFSFQIFIVPVQAFESLEQKTQFEQLVESNIISAGESS